MGVYLTLAYTPPGINLAALGPPRPSSRLALGVDLVGWPWDRSEMCTESPIARQGGRRDRPAVHQMIDSACPAGQGSLSVFWWR